jgi:hypothetical protein
MQCLRSMVSVALILFTTAAVAAETEAEKSFDKLKTLAGSWEGTGAQGDHLKVTFRVTSNGTAILSEMIAAPDDMVTMFNVDGSRLMMTHYCGTGNEPRMIGKMSPDGKTLDFTFLDGMNFNSAQPGHMHHLVVTIPDANHHSEDFTFVTQDGKQQEHDHFDLQRVKTLAHTTSGGAHAQLQAPPH